MADLDESIHLYPYNPEWADLFKSEAQRIAAARPPDITIEHIGSTSIPGRMARNDLRKKLTALGYEDLGQAGVPG